MLLLNIDMSFTALPKKGFTLIELLIVVSIIGVLSSAMIPSFNNYIKNQNVKQAREQLKSDLRNIQTNALTNAASVGSTLSNPYWGLVFVNGTNTYYYFSTASSASDYTTCLTYIVAANKYTLPNNVLINSSACVLFQPSTGSRISTLYGPVVIKESSSATYECININSEGLISTGTWNTSTNKCDE